ncbi:uncharacterized protein LOC8051442 isoform X1 [Ixodes scapularis]|uniref:uncharacterized protein LOC8051442 isoform X1 n=1 Tax=Ixodes scapularis TaxID=6945 RepID=UPI001A9E3E87|nr:uncharacterized protein LOC8051442 isoform X1 [Ixodes scapularis]
MAARYLKYLASTSLKFSPIKFRPTMSTTRCLSEQSFQVEHDEANREFFIKLGNDKAVLQYEVLNPKTLDLVHTEVPEALRGKGIAKHLAKLPCGRLQLLECVSQKSIWLKCHSTHVPIVLASAKYESKRANLWNEVGMGQLSTMLLVKTCK